MSGPDRSGPDSAETDFVSVMRAGDIAVGTTAVATPRGHPVLVARTAESVEAFDGTCPHANFRFVASALVDGREIECPMHGARFDAMTGELRCGPAKSPLRRLQSRVVDGVLEVAARDLLARPTAGVVAGAWGAWGAWSSPGGER